jgi:hypothetical protein
MKTPENHQKSKFNTSNVKKVKNSYGVYNKKTIETPNQPIETKNFLKKSMFSTSKLK